MRTIPRSTGHDKLDAIRGRMRPVGELRFGESPWDNLSKDDLIFLIQSYHALNERALSALEQLSLFGSGRFNEDAMVGTRAARDYVYSEYLGPMSEKIAYGQVEVPNSPHGYHESDVFWRATMKPVAGLLGFDTDDTVWWACDTCKVHLGITGDREPTSPNARPCEGGKRCSFRLAVWEDGRTHRENESQEAPASVAAVSDLDVKD